MRRGERRGVRSGLLEGWTTTDHCAVRPLPVLHSYSPTVTLRHQQPSLDYFISHQQTSPVTQQTVKLSNQHDRTQINIYSSARANWKILPEIFQYKLQRNRNSWFRNCVLVQTTFLQYYSYFHLFVADIREKQQNCLVDMFWTSGTRLQFS